MTTPDKNGVDDFTGTSTTGDEWDGIRELDTPLPRWWLYLFYACIAVAMVYWVLMPAWPTPNGYTPGILGFSDRANVAADIKSLQAARRPSFERLNAASYDEIVADPQLAEFARAAGETTFGDNCRTCHGAGGAGAPGYPNLADDVWIWGGTLKEIEHTLRVGIRSTHEDTRMSVMPAYGRDGLMSAKDIGDVTEYVLTLSTARDREKPQATAAARGAAIFQQQCVACHGASGAGDRSLGAPSLTDDVWLYGGSREEVRKQIELGRGGVMPMWETRLDPAMIRALAIYVYGLGGGEAEVAEPVSPTATDASPPATRAPATP